MRRRWLQVAGILLPAITVWAAAAAGQAQRQAPAFTLKNEGDVTVYELYVARGGAGARGWGPDRLGTEMVPPGRSFVVRLPAGFGCSADIRIVFDDGAEEIRERVDICREREVVVARSAPPSEPEREVEVVNAAPRSILFLYIRPAGGDDWLEDRLGQAILEPGSRFTARVPDRGCHYDVRVDYDNDAAEERRGVDLCAANPLTIAPGWIFAEDPAAFAPGAVSAAQGEVTLRNRSGRVIFALHLFPDDARDAGPDRLGMRTLADGEAITLALERGSCRFTLRVTYTDGSREERAGLDLCRSGEITIEPGWLEAVAAGAVRFVNAGSSPIVALHADRPGAALGPDRLGDRVLGVGQSLPFAPPQEGCTYDVTARFRDGRTVRLAGADLCAGGEIRLAP